MNLKLLVTLFSVLSLSLIDQPGKEAITASKEQALLSNDTLTFEIFDDPYTADEVFEMDVYSPNFNDIVAFQFAFDMPNIEFVEVKEVGVTIGEGAYHWVEDEEEFRFVWFSHTTEPQTIDPGVPLFTIVFKPNATGVISELITLDESFIASEAVPGDFDATPILLEFAFLERQASNSKDISDQDVMLYPSQIGTGFQTLSISGISIKDVSLYNFDGRRIQGVELIDNHTIQANFHNTGIYVIKLFDGNDYHTELITVN